MVVVFLALLHVYVLTGTRNHGILDFDELTFQLLLLYQIKLSENCHVNF